MWQVVQYFPENYTLFRSDKCSVRMALLVVNIKQKANHIHYIAITYINVEN